jgi:hypothetical protein
MPFVGILFFEKPVLLKWGYIFLQAHPFTVEGASGEDSVMSFMPYRISE